MLKRALIFLVKLLLFVVVIWLVVGAYWKYTDHVVSSEDLLIYFLVLPVALLLAYLLLRILWWAAKKIFHRIKAPTGIPLSATAAVHTGASADGNQTEINRPIYVIAAAMSTHFGDEGEQFLDAILQDKKRAEIHDEITQELGYGVRVASVDALEVGSGQEGVRMTLLRTQALLEKVYGQLEGVLRQAAPRADALAHPEKKHLGVQLHPEWQSGAGQQAVVPAVNVTEALPGSMPTGLGVHIVLPVFLTATETSRVLADVVAWLQASGWSKHAVKALTIQPENDVEYLRRLQTWLQTPASDASAGEWLLVLSAISWLDRDRLNDRLHTDSRFADRMAKGGVVIGELACGLLLAKARPDPQLQLEPIARLARFTLAQRSKPVDAKGAIEAELLTEMLADQVAALAQENQAFVGLTASGDLNNGRAMELGRWVTDSLPQLGFIDDVLCVAEHVGECEPAGSLLALALAAAMAQQREGTVLYCANQHPSWRALAAVMPAQ